MESDKSDTHVCRQCGVAIANQRAFFCSRECRVEFGTRIPARNAEIIKLHNSGISSQRIGSLLGLTRERVRQILLSVGLRSTYFNKRNTVITHPCPKCGTDTSNKKFCSKKCAGAARRVEIYKKKRLAADEYTCCGCGERFRRTNAVEASRLYLNRSKGIVLKDYCSRQCYIDNTMKVLVVAFGETKSKADWIRDARCKIGRNTFEKRLKRGWSAEDALTTPGATNRMNPVKLTAFGECKPICQWVSDPRCTVSENTLRARIRHGWDPEIAITKVLRFRRRTGPVE